ncbi:MAG: translocation/assembly module TamB, partial [bacterium]|nr:translocation/assembly module TamB [bacterium]
LKINNIDNSLSTEFYSGKAWNLDITFKDFDFLKPLKMLLSEKFLYNTKLSGSGIIKIKGSKDRLEDIKAEVINSGSGFIFGIPFEIIDLKTDYSKKMLTARIFSKNGVDLKVNIVGNTKELTGSIEARNLKTITKSDKIKGKITFNIITGDKLTGTVKFEDVSFTRKDWVMLIDRLNGEVKLFDKNYFVDLKGRSLGDFIKITGTGDYEFNFDIYVETKKGVAFRIPAFDPYTGIERELFYRAVPQGKPSCRLNIKKIDDVLSIVGDVVLNDTKFTYPPVKKFGRGELPFNLYLDLRLYGGENTWYENQSVSARIRKGDLLHIKGFYPSVNVTGRLNIDGGNIVYLGRNFLLKEAAFEIFIDTINGRIVEIPIISLEAETSFYDPKIGQSDTILLKLDRNRIDDINPRFVSKNFPELSSDRILEMLTGLKRDERQDYELIMKLGIIQLIDRDIGPFARKLVRIAGIDIFRIGYEGTQQETVAQDLLLRTFRGTTISTGKRITERLTGYVKFKLDEYELRPDWRHLVEFEYSIYENFKIKTTSELDTEKTLGRLPDRRVILQHKWRFGVLD